MWKPRLTQSDSATCPVLSSCAHPRCVISTTENVKMENPSLLARTLSHATVVPRPMSAQADAVNRHAMGPDLEVDEFDFDFDVVRSRLAGRHAASLQDVFALVQYQNCLVNQNNFSATGARIECLNVDAGACGSSPQSGRNRKSLMARMQNGCLLTMLNSQVCFKSVPHLRSCQSRLNLYRVSRIVTLPVLRGWSSCMWT